MNKYLNLLDKILESERVSINGLAVRCDFPSLPTIYRQLKGNKNKRLAPESLGKLEDALKIKISDNGDDIIYTKIDESKYDELDRYKEKMQGELQELEKYAKLMEELTGELAKHIGGITVLSNRLYSITAMINQKYRDNMG